MPLLPGAAIQPNLELKTQPKPVLGSLPLAFALPAPALGAAIFITVITMYLVTLCCATYVRLRCSTNPPHNIDVTLLIMTTKCDPSITVVLMISSHLTTCDNITTVVLAISSHLKSVTILLK